jgi:HD-like signal output (HDOD) protein
MSVIPVTNRPPDVPTATRTAILHAAASLGVGGTRGAGGAQLLGALCDPGTTAEAVSRLLEGEPALCARVLRVANSVFYGRPRAVGNVEKAIVLLGLDAIRGIAAAACLDRMSSGTTAVSIVSLRTVLVHSIATAAAAAELSRRCASANADDAFLAGLLHNLGVFVQARLDGARMREIVNGFDANAAADIRELEDAAALVGHEACFAVLAEDWKFPLSLAAAGSHHHRPRESPEAHRPLTTIVNLAATLAVAGGYAHAAEPRSATPARDAIEYLGIDDSVVGSVRDSLVDRVAHFRAALAAP